MSTHSRLTDNDTHFGRITIGERHPDWRPWYLVLQSGDDEHSGCALMFRALGWSVRVRLPSILKPWRRWVDTSHYEWSKNPKGGYWDVHRREYGFSLSEGHFMLYLGPQTHDSLTTKSWSSFLPWTQWHFHRHTFFGLDGEHLRSWFEARSRKQRRPLGGSRFDEQYEFKKSMPKAVFEVEDADGTRVLATTAIEEREWTFGEGAFQWLRFIRRNMVRRSLAISFAKEVGPEKGSWKGGLMGTSIEMPPGELHEAAFLRFCEQEHRAKYGRFKVKFIGQVQP